MLQAAVYFTICEPDRPLDDGVEEGGQQHMSSTLKMPGWAFVSIQRVANLHQLQWRFNMLMLRLSLGLVGCACMQGTTAEQGGRCPGTA